MAINSAEEFKRLAGIDPAKDLMNWSAHISTQNKNCVNWVPAPKPESISLNSSQRLELYYYMALMRRLDKEIQKMSLRGSAFGKHLSGAGNEATAIGASYALKKEEWVSLGIRDIGVYMLRGLPIEKLLMQACGKKDGPTNGWDSSLHMGDPTNKTIGLISHLGESIVLATGCAFTEKYHKTGRATLTFCGDGTTSTGNYHEALRIASVMKLPLVVVIENNQWAFGTPNQLEFAGPTLALEALSNGYSTEGYWIDGSNILTVYSTVKKALEKAREHNVISIIEATTMRFEGHSIVDPYKRYVNNDQLNLWKEEKDPIKNYRKLLLEQSLATEQDFNEMDMKIEEEIRLAVEITDNSPKPSISDFKGAVFAPSPKHTNELIFPPSEGKNITYHEAIRQGLQEIMTNDPDVYILGEEVGISGGAFGITAGFSEEFDHINWNEWWSKKEPPPQRRIRDVPISEAGFCGLALGSLFSGLKVIVEFQYADFASCAFPEIVNYAATQNARKLGPMHIVFRMPSGWAPHTSIYHSVNPESWFASTPGLKIVAPTTAFDAKGLLKASLYDGNPVLFLEYKDKYRINPDKLPPELNLNVPEEDYVVPIGKARIVKEGKDLSIITFGSQIFRVLEAVKEVEEHSKSTIEVIDLRTIIPYDRACVSESVKKTSKVLVTCEAPQTACFGNTIAHNIQWDVWHYLDAPVMLVGSADTPVPFAKELEDLHLPTIKKLIQAIEELIKF